MSFRHELTPTGSLCYLKLYFLIDFLSGRHVYDVSEESSLLLLLYYCCQFLLSCLLVECNLLYIFRCSCTECVYVNEYNILFLNQFLYHYVMVLLLLMIFFVLKLALTKINVVHLDFFWVNVTMVYISLMLYF